MNQECLKGKYFILLLLFLTGLNACTRVWHTADYQAKSYRISAIYDNNPANQANQTEEIILPYRQKLDTEMGRVIGHVAQRLPKGAPESLLSNWFGDMMYRQTAAHHGSSPDFAFMNSGGIRLPEMPEGELKVGKIYELMPFDNFLVVVTMKGEDVVQLFNFIGSKRGGWPVSSQVRIFYDKDGNILEFSINGEEVKNERTYQVATSSYLADGGDYLDFMIPLQRVAYPVFIRDMMIEDVVLAANAGESVNAALDGRMQIKQ